MGRYSSKPFSSLWNNSWNENVNMEVISEDFIDDLFFDRENNKLSFFIKNYQRKPKITRYVTSNYVKTPIYGDYSERTKILKKFSKRINPIRFVNEEILQLNLQKDLILEIIDMIGIIPEWRKKEIELEKISNEIKLHKKSLRIFSEEQELYSFKNTNLKEIVDNFWIRFFLGFLTFFLSFVGFISKKQAIINKIINDKNSTWNDEHKITVDQYNQDLVSKINESNAILQGKINILMIQYDKINNKEIKLEIIDEEGWTDLRISCNFSYSHLINKKGVYVIWNKTINKYYVGQSKNIGKRLSNHFKDGDVKNIVFAKDWWNGVQFMYKYHLCTTKDELDSLEKNFIEEYNSFRNGYNFTSGNI